MNNNPTQLVIGPGNIGKKAPIIPKMIKKAPNRSRTRSMDLFVVTI